MHFRIAIKRHFCYYFSYIFLIISSTASEASLYGFPKFYKSELTGAVQEEKSLTTYLLARPACPHSRFTYYRKIDNSKLYILETQTCNNSSIRRGFARIYVNSGICQLLPQTSPNC